jgi:mRNA interferase MazF
MISRGQIYFVNLNPTRGREQAGRRPVLVVSADAINRQPLVATVVVGTKSSNMPRDYPTNVRVTARESGLPYDTVFLCFQLRSLDPSRFLDPQTRQLSLAGTMPVHRMVQVDEALKLVLALAP